MDEVDERRLQQGRTLDGCCYIENIHRSGLTGVEKGSALLGYLADKGISLGDVLDEDDLPDNPLILDVDEDEERELLRKFARGISNGYERVANDSDMASSTDHRGYKNLNKIGVGERSARTWLQNASLVGDVQKRQVTPQGPSVSDDKASIISRIEDSGDQKRVHTSTAEQGILQRGRTLDGCCYGFRPLNPPLRAGSHRARPMSRRSTFRGSTLTCASLTPRRA